MLRCSGIRPISDAIRARSSTDEEVVFPAALYISSENAVPTRSLPPLHNATCASFFPYATQYTEMLSKAPARRTRGGSSITNTQTQEKTNGFITFIPLKFSLDNTELEKTGNVVEECSSVYDLKVMAISRILLAGALDNISVYWVAYGKKLAQVALCNGGSDLVGTAFSEEIYKAAGKTTSSSVEDLARIASEIGRIPEQRNTFFETIRKF